MAPRSRCTGTGFKPPCAALIKSYCSERQGKGSLKDQVSIKETNASEPLMKCRKRRDDVKTGGLSLTRDKHEGNLLTAHAASGIKVA